MTYEKRLPLRHKKIQPEVYMVRQSDNIRTQIPKTPETNFCKFNEIFSDFCLSWIFSEYELFWDPLEATLCSGYHLINYVLVDDGILFLFERRMPLCME